LLNVVEEMAIASGVPVPQVYVMDGEPGINAFAAGHSASDAAISVTHGAMTMLTRDELQGVIAHEFSHLLNGDMKLNLRLMGLIFGILCLTVIGRILIRTRGRKNPLPLLGLALIIVGWVGVLFGRLIQAAVSRQREFLADASAVQFTRNPSGLAGALKKIGGIAEGSALQSHRAEEASHFFFANGLKSGFFGFATHPPLIERIRALDPSFDGKYPSVVLPDTAVLATPPPLPGASPLVQPPPLPAMPTAKPPPLPSARPPPLPSITQVTIVADIGQPRTEHLQYAVDLHQAVAPSIQTAVRDPLGAHALVCAFLLAQGSARRPVTQFYDLRPLVRDAGILLSATAYAGVDDATQAHAAFAKGAESLGRMARTEIPWLPPTECDLSHLDAALDRFAQSVAQIKKNVLSSCAETVAFDNVIQPRETELLRAIADSLDCPIPPFLQGPTMAV